MVFPQAHLYFRINGTFGGNYASNSEKWSSGLRLGIVGADVPYDATNLQTFATTALANVRTFHSSASALVGSSCYIHDVTVARVGQDGKYLPLTQQTTIASQTPIAGSGTPDQPWSTAHVISLRTDNFRGYASNGRFYYPMLVGSLVQNNGRISPTVVDNRVNQARTLFNALNVAAAAYATNMRVVVASKTGNTQAIVHSLRADERLDSIERRENSGQTAWHVFSGIG
jgi:hypothetical protein